MITADVIGRPISHSRSRIIHGHRVDRHGIDGQYLKVPVEPAGQPEFLSGVAKRGFAGIDVTIPRKEAPFSFVSDAEQNARCRGSAELRDLVVADIEAHG